MPVTSVTSEAKEAIDIRTLADGGVAPMELQGKPHTADPLASSPDMDVDDPLDEPEAPVTMDMDTLIKSAEATGVALTATTGDRTAVIIFDWDDTLLASSFLSSNGHRLDNELELSPEMEEGLKLLEQSVTAVLTLAMRFGEVHIVTNAETGWVELSAQKWIPSVYPLLQQVKIISARSTYEQKFPAAPFQWKFQAMHSITEPKHSQFAAESKAQKHMHVISLGDSHVEREAVRAVTRGLQSVRTKSVKFAEHPSLEQLRRQLDLVSNCFQYIYAHDDDLDLMLTLTLVF